MYYTLTIDGRDKILEPHKTLADAEQFAADVAAEGLDCHILQHISTAYAHDLRLPKPEPTMMWGHTYGGAI